jgi:2-polyprenyl-3-methyl-5-hydroxy-6-metoxy-1,4-benzoquinol methylase
VSSIAVFARKLVGMARRSLFYHDYDSSAYWRKRASAPGQAAVLWKNDAYNKCYRRIQKKIIEPHIRALPEGARVLDIGCGVGIVSRMVLSIRGDVLIDAVDFDEMVSVARKEVDDGRITYISSSAEAYLDQTKKYDLVISSGCYSAIRDIASLERSIDNGSRMLNAGGKMVMIDPFHRWNYLARAKYASRDVIRFLKPRGLVLTEKGGVLFWPYREFLANSHLAGAALEKRFDQGERILKLLGQHFWADYKVLVFEKKS